ncbi:FmdB family transcriptional regulator [Actinocrinis puniceicyclus]|uniref:FmdB family transcriptional regulator n=1 Tax=Actinocrinis puniceicyclus TaxID=977794 RepID=A0A8J7WI30_9ACTN|nr:FmdB family zinc ribbon protein [Actinocrinis puniceicyclus]MBS2962638.1 FmdB family transcriptional regulator [Actinocrinis puniceicyclus]
MPTYQYQCTECGENLEVVQKFSDDALTICPSCQGALRKVYSAVGIVFKGSGFYRTDSRSSSSSSGSAAKNNGGSSAASPDSGTPSTGSAAAPASTSPSASKGTGPSAPSSSSTSAAA